MARQILVGRHSQVTSPPTTRSVPVAVPYEQRAVGVDAARDAAARSVGMRDLDGGAGGAHRQLLPARAHDRGVSGAQPPHPGAKPREAGAEHERGIHRRAPAPLRATSRAR